MTPGSGRRRELERSRSHQKSGAKDIYQSGAKVTIYRCRDIFFRYITSAEGASATHSRAQATAPAVLEYKFVRDVFADDSSGGLRLGSLEPLHLGVHGHAAEGEACPDEVELGDGGREEEDGGHDDDHALDAVPDGVRDGAHTGKDHVGHLLVGVEAERGNEGPGDDEV